MHELLTRRLGRKVVADGRRLGYAIELDEAAPIIMTRLLSDDRLLAALSIEDPDDPRFIAAPFSYLARCVTGWVGAESGTRAATLEDDRVADTVWELPDSHWADAAVKTARVVVSRTPARFQDPVRRTVGVLAGVGRWRMSYEQTEIDRVASLVPELNRRQVAAVWNITWGGRPSPADTGLLPNFARDLDFRPSASSSHLRSLCTYQKRISA